MTVENTLLIEYGCMKQAAKEAYVQVENSLRPHKRGNGPPRYTLFDNSIIICFLLSHRQQVFQFF
jgi:hypothetical protein